MSRILLALAALWAGNQDKLPVPDGARLKEAEKLVREVFQDDYAKRASTDRITFARKLVRQGQESKEDPATQFVLFSEAREIASQAGDVDAALAAVAELEKLFHVDAGSMRSSILATASKAAKSPEEFQRLGKISLQLAEDAAGEARYDAAEKSADLAAQLARKSKDLALLTNATARLKDYAELRAKVERTERARETLARNPDDPEANLLLGRFLCFVKGEWDAGLRHLAKGNDGVLKDLAAKESARPADATDQVALGDAWWEAGEKDAAQKAGLRQRAVFWYGLARERLSGLTRARIEKRVEGAALPPSAGAKKVSSIPLDAQTFGGHAYRHYPEHLTWQEAKEFCEKLGGHLATITSREEGQFVCTLFPAPKEIGPWIGLSWDIKGREWKWVTGEPVKHSNWAPTEPNHMDAEHWVEIAPRGIGEHWNNVGGGRRPFLCEWDR
jgi:hypothetical protein